MNLTPRPGTARRLGLRRPNPYAAKIRRLDVLLRLGFSGEAAARAAGLAGMQRRINEMLERLP